jgi:magnesium transporter
MIRTQLIDASGNITQGGEELIEQVDKQVGSRIWIDMEIGDKNLNKEFLLQLGCHALAVQDALRTRHPPKIEYFSEHVFILYRGILDVGTNLNIKHLQIAFFISENKIITLRHGHSKGIENIWNLQQEWPLLEGPLNCALKIMHSSSGFYLEQMLQFETNVSDLEDAFLREGNDQMMAELISYKSRLVKLRRVFNYHKAISDGLHSDKSERSPFVRDEHIHEIIDVKDRFERLFSLAQMHYEICGDLLDGYLSISSHRLNVTMRVLTVITAIFVPLSFLAGLYGMNFDNIPELHWQYGYFTLIGVMALVACALLFTFKRKNWM